MPKVNVYLPDELAETVRELDLPVSAVCQRALEQSVRRVGAIRAVALATLPEGGPTAGLNQFTERAKDVINLAISRAGARGADEVGTEDLLYGIVTEGSNLALQVLRALEVEPEHLLRGLTVADGEPGRPTHFSRTAANALELTVTEAVVLGHNYVGCEHLLLGLLAEPDGTASRVLRGVGLESKSARQSVTVALAGYVHLQANQSAGSGVAAVISKALEPVVKRLDRLEEQAGLR